MAWLLGSAARAALALAIAWLVAALLRRSAPAVRHQIWALGVVAALLVPILSWSLPALLVPVPVPGSGGLLSAGLAAAEAAALPPVAAPTWPVWLALGWAAGAGVVAIRVLRGHLAAWRLSASSVPVLSGACRSALGEAAGALGVARVELRRSDRIGSPMTVGVLLPWILVPPEAEDWPPERLRAILIHELGHVRRRDALLQLLAQAATCAYWWNPLAWLAARRLRVEREHACDDLVIAAGVRPSSYAADLLAVARTVSSRAPLRADAIGAVEPSWTEVRLRRILDPAAPRQIPGVPVRLAVSAVALALASILARSSALAEPLRPAVPLPVCGSPSNDEPGAPSAVDLDAPLATGEALDPTVVAREVEAGLGDIDGCFPPELLDQAPSGSVVVHWTVDLWGNATNACITQDTLGDEAVIACVNRLIEGGRFPGIRGRTVEVSLPLRR
jgi:beta-lactamase regulating signal transducer with metallopeptidase domain